jgi:hypothetical protein
MLVFLSHYLSTSLPLLFLNLSTSSFSQLLFFIHIHTKVDKDTMLVRVTKSWDVKETMKFLARQPLVSSMTLDSKKYAPSDFYDEDGDEL